MKKIIFVVLLITLAYFAYQRFFGNSDANMGSYNENQFLNESKTLNQDFKNNMQDPEVQLSVLDRCSVFSLLFQFPPKNLPQAKQFALQEMAYVDLTKATLDLINSSFKDKDATSAAEMKNIDRITSQYNAYLSTNYLNQKGKDISQDSLIQADYEMCSTLMKSIPKDSK